MNSVIRNIQNMKKSIYSSININSKIELLIDCSQEYEQLINNYMTFIKENDYVLEKIYIYKKELFNIYSERILLDSEKIVDKKISKANNLPKIIIKIKERMNNLISVVGYVADLLDIFLDVRENSKNEFYQILTNFMELMNILEDEIYWHSEVNGKHRSGYVFNDIFLFATYANKTARIWNLATKNLYKEIQHEGMNAYDIIQWNNKFMIFGTDLYSTNFFLLFLFFY